jgi:Flp pilus assembly pilin Flp
MLNGEHTVKTRAIAGARMTRTAERLVREDGGQDLIEYALLAALLGVACITGLLQLSRIREFFAMVGRALDAA